MDRTLPLLTLLLVGSVHQTSATEHTVGLVLDKDDLKLGALTSRLVELSAKLDLVIQKTEITDIDARRLSGRLDHVQGKRGPCEERFFPCSSGPEGSVQCIRDYLVCDKYKDCKNGADEAESICKIPFEVPGSLSGHLLRNDCRTNMPSAPIEEEMSNMWAIQRLDIIPWFPSRPQLVYYFTVTKQTSVTQEEGAMELRNSYGYAHGDFTVSWTAGHSLVGICKFQPLGLKKFAYHCYLDRTDFDLQNKRNGCAELVYVNEPVNP